MEAIRSDFGRREEVEICGSQGEIDLGLKERAEFLFEDIHDEEEEGNPFL